MERQVLDAPVFPELVREIALFGFVRIGRGTRQERPRLQDREAGANRREVGDDGWWRIVHAGDEVQELPGYRHERDILYVQLAAFDEAQEHIEWTLVRGESELVVGEGWLVAVGALIHTETV